MLPRYEESNLSPESSQNPPREVETSAGVALLSEWGYALILRWDRWDLVPFLHGQTMRRVALLNTSRDRSCVGIFLPKGVTLTAGKVRLKSCDCPAFPLMAWCPSFVLSHSGTGFSLEVTGYMSCGSFYQSLHYDILSFLPFSTIFQQLSVHHCLACTTATAFTHRGPFIQVCWLIVPLLLKAQANATFQSSFLLLSNR